MRHLPILFRTTLAVLLTGNAGACFDAEAVNVYPEPMPGLITSVLQLRRLTPNQGSLSCRVQLEGIVLGTNPARNELFLQDDTGGIAVHMDLRRVPSIRRARKVVVEGRCIASAGRIVSEALVDNDGIHSAVEKSMTMFLLAGLHPITVEWFNGPQNSELTVDWMGPDRPRQHIPDSALFRPSAKGGTNEMVRGLSYRCYEGTWSALPDFSQLPVVRQGDVANFDLRTATRETDVGLVFSGYLEIPSSGDYTFWTRSDDGSRLYFDDQLLQVRIIGSAGMPVAHRIVPGENVLEERDCQWAEAEGTVTAASKFAQGTSLTLAFDAGRTSLIIRSGDDAPLGLLLHSRIRAQGIYQTVFGSDGQKVPCLLVPDCRDEMQILEMDPAHWVEYPLVPIGTALEKNPRPSTGEIMHIRGVVSPQTNMRRFGVEDGTGCACVETAQALPAAGEQVEVLGRCSREGTNVVLRSGFYQRTSLDSNRDSAGLPCLTKAMQVMSLSRAEAQRGYPVRLRGVITAIVSGDFFLQDPTWSIYASCSDILTSENPQVGDYWEIEGKSSVHFAPDVQVSRAAYLGKGKLPEPIHPTWDELVNGSLATKYIEIQGVATAASGENLKLLTPEGIIELILSGSAPKSLKKLEGALIRVRGVGSPDRDTNQMILMLTRLRLYNASVNVDEATPSQPFDTPLRHTSDLLLFDAKAANLRRIKVAGQVLQGRRGEYFLMDGLNGFRIKPREAVRLQPGELVEVVGFPDMSGPTPVLLEALVRVTGATNLPAPIHLCASTLLNRKLDSTRVRLESRLVDLSTDRSDHVLELITGTRSYIARLANKRGNLLNILPGSLLELTGVYAGQGGDRASNQGIDSFELLLNSTADIRVLARPSWWTVRHTLIVIGGLLLVTLGALVWVTMLRRQVEERTAQLAAEINSRELAERQRALETERARIAQDLHDDLGATLTEIRFLSAVEGRDSLVPQATRSQLIEVSEKSRQMLSSLDEIVWAVNPANDSLPSLTSYLRHVAEEFFRATEVRCRLDVDPFPPPVALTSEVRHNLYLAVREALNNVAKHSRASEAWLRIHWQDEALDIVIEDNGCGFTDPEFIANGNGLYNMKRRLEAIGGRFECDSRTGLGTSCRIHLPLASRPKSALASTV